MATVKTIPVDSKEYFYQEKRELKKRILQNAIFEKRSLTDEEEQRIKQIDMWLEESQEIRQMKGNENNMIENKDFEKFLKNENQKTYEVETRNVSLMADNTDVKVQNMADYMVKSLFEQAELFGRCQAFTPANGVLSIPKEDDSNLNDVFEFVGENTTVDVHKIQFHTVKAEAKRLGVCVKVTEQMVLNSGVDIQSYVLNLLARKLSRCVNRQMVEGNHPASFEGLTSLTAEKHGVKEVDVAALDSDGLLDCIHSMHPDYLDGAVFVVNRNAYNAIAKLKDASGQYILKLERSVAKEATHYTAFGFPLLIHENVPEGQVYFVNFREAYASIVPRSVRVKKIDNDSANALNATVVYMIDAYMDAVCKNGKAVVKLTLTETETE